jgi:hypothetical protein
MVFSSTLQLDVGWEIVHLQCFWLLFFILFYIYIYKKVFEEKKPEASYFIFIFLIILKTTWPSFPSLERMGPALLA